MNEAIRPLKDALEKPEQTKEHTKKNTNGYFMGKVKKIMNLSQKRNK